MKTPDTAKAVSSATRQGAQIISPGGLPAKLNTVTAEVLARLLNYERLTSLDAVDEASTTRLSAVTFYLAEKYGWPIEAVDKAAAQPFKLQIETLGTDDYGDAVTSCVVVADHAERDVKRVKVPQGGNQSLVYSAIRGMFKDGISGKPGAPPLRPCIELEAAVIRGAGSLTCPTDKRTSRTRDAIAGLVTRGVLGLNEGYLWLV